MMDRALRLRSVRQAMISVEEIIVRDNTTAWYGLSSNGDRLEG